MSTPVPQLTPEDQQEHLDKGTSKDDQQIRTKRQQRASPRTPRIKSSLKLRWMMWKARLSIPNMLAQGDEGSVVSLFTSINGGMTILIICLLAWIWNLPLLFPTLGPTLFIIHSSPLSRAAAPRSIILGHFSAITIGSLCWYAASAIVGPSLSMQNGGLTLVCSASLALAITCNVLVRLSCPHAPACASALVITLGGVEAGLGSICLAVAVTLVVVQAIAINRLASVPVPLWSPRTIPHF